MRRGFEFASTVVALVAAAAIVGAGVLVASPRRASGGASAFDKATCSFNGKKLYGKIEIVTAFPDVKVQEVKAFPDLKIEEVNAFPDKCGLWQLVKAFPNTKVQYVNAFPDVKIQHVKAFPGVP